MENKSINKVAPFSKQSKDSKKVDTFSDDDERDDEQLVIDSSKYVGASKKLRDTIDQDNQKSDLTQREEPTADLLPPIQNKKSSFPWTQTLSRFDPKNEFGDPVGIDEDLQHICQDKNCPENPKYFKGLEVKNQVKSEQPAVIREYQDSELQDDEEEDHDDGSVKIKPAEGSKKNFFVT